MGILILGALLLLLTVWSWVGRGPGARWWTTGFDIDRVGLGILPFAGLLVFGLALVATAVPALELVGALCWLASFPVFVIGMIRPRWWGPRWFREQEAARRGGRQRRERRRRAAS